MGNGFVRCKVIDPMLKQHYGDFAYYDEAKSQELSSLGLVEVVQEDAEEDTGPMMRHDLAGLPKPEPVQTSQNQPAGTPPYLTRGGVFKRGTPAGRKVAWLQDYSRIGGAELSNAEVVRMGESLGYDIIGVTPATYSPSVLLEADFLVVNNLFEFKGEHLTEIRYILHEKRVPYIKYEHDHRELRRVNISRVMFRDAKLVVFLSPKHQEDYHEILGAEATRNSIILPLAISASAYKPADVVREKGLTIVPTPKKMDPKVYEKYLSEFPDRNLLIVGQCTAPIPPKRVEYVKSCPADKMAALYSRCEFMLHKPVQKWAGERVYFEALLCGCVPIVNDRVGHASWTDHPEKLTELRKWLTLAPVTFWKAIEEVIG